MEKLFYMGKVVKSKGLDGTIKCQFAKNSDDEIKTIKKIIIDSTVFNVQRAYGGGGFAFFKLAGIDSLESAQSLIGKDINLQREDASPLQKNEFYIADLIGSQVQIGSTKIGYITDIQNYGASSDIISIATKSGEIMVPNIQNLIESFNADQNITTINKKIFMEVSDYEI